MKFEFKPWLTKANEFHTKSNKGVPIPLRVMFGTIVRSTDKAYVIEVKAKPVPSTHCMSCGRGLTHKVSMFYGLGPDCGKHFYISMVNESAIEEYLHTIRKNLAQVTWRGIVPKSAVVVTPEVFHTIVFNYRGKEYTDTTSDESRIKQIYSQSDFVISDIKHEG